MDNKLRLSNLHIPIETGRWKNVPMQNRKCHLCSTGDVSDEFHYLFICKYDQLVSQRCKLIPSYLNIQTYKKCNFSEDNSHGEVLFLILGISKS